MSENKTNYVVERVLFIFSAVAISVLAVLFSLEAFGIGAHQVTSEVGHLFMAPLITYVAMKRAGRWKNGKENLRRGEWFAVGFMAYAALVIAPLYFMLKTVAWPPMLTPITFEVLGLLAGNEVIKTISQCRKKD